MSVTNESRASYKLHNNSFAKSVPARFVTFFFGQESSFSTSLPFFGEEISHLQSFNFFFSVSHCVFFFFLRAN